MHVKTFRWKEQFPLEHFSRCMCNPMYFYRPPKKLREGDVSQAYVCRGREVPRSLPGVEAGWYPWFQVISRGVGTQRGVCPGVGTQGVSTQRAQYPGAMGTRGESVHKGWVFGVSLFRVWVLRRLSTWRWVPWVGTQGVEYPHGHGPCHVLLLSRRYVSYWNDYLFIFVIS